MQARNMRTSLICCICKAQYRETQNLGSWHCFQHTGCIVNGRWTCCNMSTGNSGTIEQFYRTGRSNPEKGCVRCDHRVTFDTYTMETGTIQMTTQWYKLLQNENLTSSEAVVSMTPEETVLRRFDMKTQEKLQMVMTMHCCAEGIPSLAKHRVNGSLSHKPLELEQMLERI